MSIIEPAANLLTEPGDSNPEYDRALVELVRDVDPEASDLSRADILRLLRRHNHLYDGLDDTICDRCGTDAGADLFTHPDDPHGYCEPCFTYVHKGGR